MSEAETTPPRRRWLLWALLALAVLVAMALAALGGGTTWLLRSDAGARWLLQRVPGLSLEGLQGSLAGPDLQARRLKLVWANGQQSLLLEEVELRGLQWHWRPDGQAWVGIDLQSLRARQATLLTGPASGKPPTPPASLALPLRLNLASLQVGTLQVDQWPAAHQLRARLQLGAANGSEHRVEDLAFDWERLQLNGRLQVGARGELPVQAALTLKPRVDAGASAPAPAAPPAPLRDWQARVQLNGPLQALQAQASLQGSASPGHAAPQLDLRAQLQPFAAWPLASLALQTAGLDLAAFSAALPRTALRGTAQVNTRAADAPVSVLLKLDNAQAGRWNEGLAPLRRIELDLQGQRSEAQRLGLQRFDIELGTAAQPAGRWQGSGEWKGHGLALQSQISTLRPQWLDARSAAMVLGGPLQVQVMGLPAPDGTAAPAGSESVQFKASLLGRLDALPRPVKLQVDATARPGGIDVRQLLVDAGDAQAQSSGQLSRSAAGQLRLQGQAQLQRFDPLPWWPGAAAAGLGSGPHRFSGQATLDIQASETVLQRPLPALLQSLQGHAEALFKDSLLFGLPMALNARLATSGPASSGDADLRLGASRLQLQASGQPLGRGEADRWRVEVSSPDLAELAPLGRLHSAIAANLPQRGRLQAQAEGSGRWPALKLQGQAKLNGLQLKPFSLDEAQLSGQYDGRAADAAAATLDLQLRAQGLARGTQRLQSLQATLSGNLARHRLQAGITAPLKAPPAFQQWLGLPPQTDARAGSQFQLQAEGAWEPRSGGGGTWRGGLQRFAAGPWDGRSAADGSAAWVLLQGVQAEALFSATGELQRASLAPGRSALPGGFQLRWEEARYEAGGDAPRYTLRAQVEDFDAAPLLARLQPELGWQGDLKVGAQIDLRAQDKFDADLVLQRSQGDLSVADGAGRQALGLSDLRLAVAAHDGTWYFTQAMAGRVLGEMAGAVGLQTSAQRRWPEPGAAINGVIEARVANLGVWGTWVPPGWRLAGALQTSAVFGGSFGDPQITGALRGQGIGVRNLLQGVNITDGEVSVALKGSSAQIEKFTLKGGEGSLRVEGGATLGAAPQADLRLVAERFQLLGRIDRQIITSGNARMSLNATQLKLDGSFAIDQGLVDFSRGDAPGLDDDVHVKERSTSPAAATEPGVAAPALRNVQVNVGIDLGPALRLRGRGLDTLLRGQLRLGTPGGRLAVNGSVRAENGTYAAYGQKLQIERGEVVFSGPADNPRLDILALRPNLDVRVGVAVTGQAGNPRVRLYSEPDMGDTDKLSWLVLGRASDGLGRTDTALLQRAAVALLAGEGEGPGANLLGRLGLDDISLRQSDGEVRETVIALGKQLSQRWYVGYERGVNATTGTWQLVYRVAQRFTLRAQSGLENSLDAIWTWRWQ